MPKTNAKRSGGSLGKIALIGFTNESIKSIIIFSFYGL
jgi:hypothetical protein